MDKMCPITFLKTIYLNIRFKKKNIYELMKCSLFFFFPTYFLFTSTHILVLLPVFCVTCDIP